MQLVFEPSSVLLLKARYPPQSCKNIAPGTVLSPRDKQCSYQVEILFLMEHILLNARLLVSYV